MVSPGMDTVDRHLSAALSASSPGGPTDVTHLIGCLKQTRSIQKLESHESH